MHTHEFTIICTPGNTTHYPNRLIHTTSLEYHNTQTHTHTHTHTCVCVYTHRLARTPTRTRSTLHMRSWVLYENLAKQHDQWTKGGRGKLKGAVWMEVIDGRMGNQLAHTSSWMSSISVTRPCIHLRRGQQSEKTPHTYAHSSNE
jgi:hypothetical protein